MMKVSNAYFKHPVTGEIIKPGEMYQDFGLGSVSLKKSKTAEVDIKKEEPEKTNKPLSECGVTELKKLAKEAKIDGYTKMEKEELITALESLMGGAPDQDDGDAENADSNTEVIENGNSENN